MITIRRMRISTCLVALMICQAIPSAVRAEDAQLVDARKIWDAGDHNAFTDLTRWHDRWWCTFRESHAHVGGDGKVRVITSADGQQWESAALLEEKGVDLRDPKFSITPDNRLMIVAGGSIYNGTKKLASRQPRVMFSTDGRTWTEPHKVLAEGDWLWRVTWHEGKAYGVSYLAPAAPKPWAVNLYSSADGISWELVAPLDVTAEPNETTLRFDKAGNMLALVRREMANGCFGSAKPPYKEWEWHELNEKIGGPNFIQLPDGSLVSATRHYAPKKATTLISRLTPTGRQPLLTLPSGGDCSYAGLVFHDDLLWISYYSSHEGKTSIYLAKVKVR